MNIEEYKSIRDEMLQRFRWTTELSVFSVVSTGALLSWLSTARGQIPTELSPLLFIFVGLGIIGFIFYSYLELLRGIYNQGSYLTIFHERIFDEGNEQAFGWHALSRFRKELNKKEADWGRDGRRGGYLLLLLLIANLAGPLLLIWKTMDIFPPYWYKDWSILLPIAAVVGLVVWISITAWGLFHTRKFMKDNLKEWMQTKDNLKKDPNLLETTMKSVLRPRR